MLFVALLLLGVHSFHFSLFIALMYVSFLEHWPLKFFEISVDPYVLCTIINQKISCMYLSRKVKNMVQV